MTDTLPTTALGNSGIQVSAQGLGCMGISDFYGPSDLTESRATLDRALELGVTLYDTADVYGSGNNEEFLSDFVRADRDRVVLATKFGIVRKADDPTFRGIENSPSTSVVPSMPACAASASTPSTCTTCTAATRRSRSRNPSARWRNSSRRARFGRSACPR